jgi:hypothetical protein
MRACTRVRRVRRAPEGLSGAKGRLKSGFILSQLDSKGSEWPRWSCRCLTTDGVVVARRGAEFWRDSGGATVRVHPETEDKGERERECKQSAQAKANSKQEPKFVSIRCTIPVVLQRCVRQVGWHKKIVSLGVCGYCWWLAQLSLMAREVRQLRTHRTVGGLACEPAGDEP